MTIKEGNRVRHKQHALEGVACGDENHGRVQVVVAGGETIQIWAANDCVVIYDVGTSRPNDAPVF